MDLVVQLLVGIAWPVTVLILVFAFRRDLANAVAKLTKLRYKDFEAEFERTLRELESQRPALSALPLETTPMGRSLLDRRKEISSLAAVSPRAAIMEAWLEVERSLLAVARQAGVPAERGAGQVARLLARKDIIPVEYAGTIDRVRQLRNVAAHEPEFVLSETEAKEYVDFALEIAASIELLGEEHRREGSRPEDGDS